MSFTLLLLSSDCSLPSKLKIYRVGEGFGVRLFIFLNIEAKSFQPQINSEDHRPYQSDLVLIEVIYPQAISVEANRTQEFHFFILI